MRIGASNSKNALLLPQPLPLMLVIKRKKSLSSSNLLRPEIRSIQNSPRNKIFKWMRTPLRTLLIVKLMMQSSKEPRNTWCSVAALSISSRPSRASIRTLGSWSCSSLAKI